MKERFGWHLPDTDSHFEPYLAAQLQRTGEAQYQPAQRAAALRRCVRFDCALDIGGHIGLWSRPLCESFGRVIAFEPCSEYHAMFALNAPKAELMPFALGEEPGRVGLVFPPDNSGAAYIDLNDSAANLEMRTLDSFELSPVNLIKIDCEGFELPIVRGAKQLLLREDPVIVVEQKPHPHFGTRWSQMAAVEYLVSLGYEVIDRVVDDWILQK